VNEVFLRKIRVLQIIHGTGEGILKSEIRKQLDQLGVEYFDAPLNIYGVGATTARFKH
jgi:dsDNA-specific endonuclease/ATPase MutS2